MRELKLSFVHGFMGQPTDWDEVRAKFSSEQTDSFAIDASDDWASSLACLRTKLPERSILIGYSMGARLALGLALEYPECCSGLVFVSGNPGLENDEDRRQRLEVDKAIAQRLVNTDPGEFLRWWYSLPVFSTVPARIKDAEIDRKLGSFSEHWQTILFANSIAQQPNYWPRLGELSVPVLIVAGQLDRKYATISRRFAESNPKGDFCANIINDCGHIVHREQRDAFVEELRRFCKRVK